MAAASTSEDSLFSSALLSIHAILEDTVDKLHIVDNLKPPKDSGSDDSLHQTIDDKRRFENRYKVMMNQRDHAKTAPLDRRSGDLRSILGQFRDASSKVKRKMDQNRTKADITGASTAATKFKHEKNDVFKTLGTAIGEIATCGATPTLNQLLEDDTRQKYEYEEASQKVQALHRSTTHLEEELIRIRESKVEESEKIKETSILLKQTLEEAKYELQVNQVVKVQESESRINTLRRIYKSVEDKMSAELEDLRLSLRREDKAHSHSSEYFRRRLKVIQTDEQFWRKKAGSEVPAAKEALENLTDQRNKTLADLQSHDEKLKIETARRDARLEEMRQTQDNLRKNLHSAILIQKMYRGFKVRHELKKQNTSKKKGKKGKGKKK